MTDVTRILSDIKQGAPSAADQLLPLVYEDSGKPNTVIIVIDDDTWSWKDVRFERVKSKPK
jgi:hypothetical protein